MSNVRKHIGIPGVGYRARMRLVSGGGLDSLSQFILDQVLQKENRISILLQSFGLPRGVIEDSLTELLESNRVSLDVLTGRINKSTVRPDRRESRIDPPFDVWQDECTGAVLPLSMVRQFADSVVPNESGDVLWLRSQTRTRDLLDLPGARALGSLLSADQSLRTNQSGWIPESLVNVEKIGPYDLCLPVDEVELDGKIIEFVSGKGLPSWLTRSWSFELATSELSREAPEGRLEKQHEIRSLMEEVTSNKDLQRATEILDLAKLTHILNGWRKNLDEALAKVVEFAKQRNGFALEQLKFRVSENTEALTSHIVSSGRIRFARPTTTHLEEMWVGAESYLLIAHNCFTVEELEQVWTKTEKAKVSAVHLIFLDCSGKEITEDVENWLEVRAERALGGEIVLIRAEATIEADVCIVDGREARIGSLSSLLSSTDPVVIAEGRTVMQHLAASISKEISPQEAGGWWVLRQLSPALVESIDACEGLKGILEDFAFLSDDLEELIDDIGESISDGADTDSPESNSDGEFGRVGQIELRAWEGCNHLLEEFSKNRMLIVPVAGGDLSSVRQKILEIAGSEQGHELDIILTRLPLNFNISIFLGELHKIIENGSSVRLTLCQPNPDKLLQDDVITGIDLLMKHFDNNNMVIQTSNVELPSTLILDRKTVAICWGNWFDSIASDVGRFGFVVESELLAGQIT